MELDERVDVVDPQRPHARAQEVIRTRRAERGQARGLGARHEVEHRVVVAEAADDLSVSERTWVLLTEAVEGGWGLGGKAHTNAEFVDAARAEITRLSGQGR